jgi:CBS domain containing-hemolysin-like protein
MTGEIVAFILAVLLSMVCNATETAYSAAGRIRIAAASQSGHRLAKLASWFLNDLPLPVHHPGRNQRGGHPCLEPQFRLVSPGSAPATRPFSVVVTASFLLVFAEIVPKQNALLRADSLTPPLAPALVVLRVLFFPLIASAGFISRIIAAALR